MVYLNNGSTGSVTFIGTVSPAGGNLKEPVTESTKKVARCFYALSQARADSKRYPAIDTLESYSKYLEYPEFVEYARKNISDRWIEDVNEARNMLVRGRETAEQIDILGDDGVPLDYHLIFWKSELIDFVILLQDHEVDQLGFPVYHDDIPRAHRHLPKCRSAQPFPGRCTSILRASFTSAIHRVGNIFPGIFDKFRIFQIFRIRFQRIDRRVTFGSPHEPVTMRRNNGPLSWSIRLPVLSGYHRQAIPYR